ncbi:RNA methyltransferase [Chitinophaga sp. B61]|uniref:RNA methyltransferase n=2 Tax=Chitinophaga rhizophila TaxID=2866212 RepID=A0ABS7G8Q2_9BACT|nr:RNA methyltransferase [Chitinophaga rhizophila]MBW8684042.1 RNA methyltransferase [Chitinophaga rhizophila]
MDELGRKTVDQFRAADKTPLVLVLDNVRSMHNVGSVFRTADGFLLQGIVLCGYTPVPPHRDIQKTALGATETVEWQYFPTTVEAVNALREAGYTIMAVEQAVNSVMLDQYTPNAEKPLALVFGNEVSGVDGEVMKLVDGCIEIPQSGMKHSLNISVSTGIVVWDIFAKLKKQQSS